MSESAREREVNTPKPWKVQNGTVIVTDNGARTVIAKVWPGTEANAALIVRAVNAHQALVEALTVTQTLLDNHGIIHPGEWKAMMQGVEEKVSAALKLAESD